jgi:hypothetical protein
MVDARFGSGKEFIKALGLVADSSPSAFRRANLGPLRKTPKFILLSYGSNPMPQTSINFPQTID